MVIGFSAKGCKVFLCAKGNNEGRVASAPWRKAGGCWQLLTPLVQHRQIADSLPGEKSLFFYICLCKGRCSQG